MDNIDAADYIASKRSTEGIMNAGLNSSAGGEVMHLAQDCFNASYGTVLRLLGLAPVVLGAEFGFWWRQADGRSTVAQLQTSRSTRAEWVQRWYPQLKVDEVTHADPTALWRHLCAAASPTQPVIVSVDWFELPYSPHYQEMHFGHQLVVVGAGDIGVDVIDGYRGGSYQGRLTPGQFQAGIASLPAHTGSPRPVSVGFSCSQEDAPPQLSPDTVASSLRTSAALMLSTGAADPLEGMSAVAAFIDFLAAHTHDAALDPAEFRRILTRLGGLSSQRTANADFLVMAAAMLDAPGLLDAAAQATECANGWLRMRNLFYLRAVESGAVPQRLVGQVERLGVLDVAMSEQIIAALATHVAP